MFFQGRNRQHGQLFEIWPEMSPLKFLFFGRNLTSLTLIGCKSSFPTPECHAPLSPVEFRDLIFCSSYVRTLSTSTVSNWVTEDILSNNFPELLSGAILTAGRSLLSWTILGPCLLDHSWTILLDLDHSRTKTLVVNLTRGYWNDLFKPCRYRTLNNFVRMKRPIYAQVKCYKGDKELDHYSLSHALVLCLRAFSNRRLKEDWMKNCAIIDYNCYSITPRLPSLPVVWRSPDFSNDSYLPEVSSLF